MSKRAEELVELLKEGGAGTVVGDVGKGIARAIEGTYRTIGAGTRGAAEEASKRLGGGVKGTIAEGAIRSLPWIAGAGAINYAAGDPVGRRYQEEKDRLRARIAATRSVWNPQRNMMI